MSGPPPTFQDFRARLRRIVDRLDAIVSLYPRIDDEPVTELDTRIQDGRPIPSADLQAPEQFVQDVAMFIVVDKAQFLIQGDPLASLITGTEEEPAPGRN